MSGMFSIGGLSSGLDTKAIIGQLMQIESQPRVKIEWNKALWEARKTAWTDLNSRLLTLQNHANTLNSPSTWTAAAGVTSSDSSKVTGTTVGSNPAAGTYAIEVSQLAATEVWSAANSLPASVGGVRQSGSWYEGAFTEASGATLLTGITDWDGTPAGLDVGSEITLSASVNGSPVSATYTVGAASTLDDLVSWAESQFAGASFAVNPDGTVTYQSAAGGSNEITALSFSAVNSSGTALSIFNGSAGAQSSLVSAASGGAAANDTLTITQGASTWNISVSAGDDASVIASKINATAGIGVAAAVVSGKLQLTANNSGAAGAFTVSSSGSLASDLGMAQTTAGQDAQFTVDGTAYTRTKNSGITDVITDVSLNLLNMTAGAVNLTVSASGPADPAAVKAKIMDFVKQYNAVIDYVAARTGEQKAANPKNLAEFLQGPVSRNYAMSSVSLDMRRWATEVVGGLPSGSRMLADIGITTGAVSASYSPENTSGRLVVDEAKLDAALASDPQAVQDIFTRSGGGTLAGDGIARRMSKLVSQWRSGGKVDASIQGASSQINRLQDSLDRFSDRLDRKREYYERMFASLETALGRMQQQGSWLSGQLAGMM